MVGECMNDDADAISLATNVLIQLFGNRFRQWEVTINRCGKRDFLAPLPETMDASWACNKVSLLDFLRKTNGNGQVVDWLPKRTRI